MDTISQDAHPIWLQAIGQRQSLWEARAKVIYRVLCHKVSSLFQRGLDKDLEDGGCHTYPLPAPRIRDPRMPSACSQKEWHRRSLPDASGLSKKQTNQELLGYPEVLAGYCGGAGLLGLVIRIHEDRWTFLREGHGAYLASIL